MDKGCVGFFYLFNHCKKTGFSSYMCCVNIKQGLEYHVNRCVLDTSFKRPNTLCFNSLSVVLRPLSCVHTWNQKLMTCLQSHTAAWFLQAGTVLKTDLSVVLVPLFPHSLMPVLFFFFTVVVFSLSCIVSVKESNWKIFSMHCLAKPNRPR